MVASKLTVIGSCGAVRTFNKDFAQHRVALAAAAATSFPGASVITGTDTRPGGATVGGYADVGSEFDQYGAGRFLIDPGNSLQKKNLLLEVFEAFPDELCATFLFENS